MKLVFLFFSLFFTVSTFGQHLSAYSDYMDRFFIFEKGKSTQVEHLPVQSFKVGGECIIYVTNASHLKMYYNGNVVQLEAGGSGNYFATDHLAAYSVFEKLRAIRRGKVYDLSMRCTAYFVEDSLVAFYDKNKESLRVFYDGEIQDIESGMIGTPVKFFDSGDNTVAYISERSKDFKVWYKGEVHTLQTFVEGVEFKAGADIVAYFDEINQAFRAFYKGEVYNLEEFKPQSFKVGDGFVAYVDNMGSFKVFYDGEIQEIGGFAPDAYLTEDYLLVYTEDRYFKTFYNGEVHEVEGFIPSKYKLDWNTVAYLDNSDRIWIYRNGEKKYLANELVNSFEIYRDLIQMNVKVNRNIIYYQDQYYEGESFYK